MFVWCLTNVIYDVFIWFDNLIACDLSNYKIALLKLRKKKERGSDSEASVEDSDSEEEDEKEEKTAKKEKVNTV